MYTLGIDTSCDDTSVALLNDDGTVKLSLISSQVALHEPHGGVVPEIASRSHAEVLPLLFDKLLRDSGITLAEIGAVAVTYTPGLIGCLLVGVNFAKALAYQLGVPMYAVHHLEGHLFSPFIGDSPAYPFLGLVVSGGHTAFYRVNSPDIITVLGQTVDDAVGEVYDKIAKHMGLGYPGGPIIDRLAASGDASRFIFKKPHVKMGENYLSFSGLKTAAWQILQKEQLDEKGTQDLCASLQEVLVGVLVEKAQFFAEKENLETIAVSGGVAMNSRLRADFKAMVGRKNYRVIIADKAFCTDNAAMIAFAAILKKEETSPLELNAMASQKIQARALRRDQNALRRSESAS